MPDDGASYCEPTVQFVGFGTRLGALLVCLSYIALLLRHFKAPVTRIYQIRIYRLAEGAWLLNATLLLHVLSVGFHNITAAEYLTLAHIFSLNAAIIAHGRTIGWTHDPPLDTTEYTLMLAGKEVCMTGTFIARTVLAWWFWVSMYSRMLDPCSSPSTLETPLSEQRSTGAVTTTYAFFFWKVHASGWFRIVSIAHLSAAVLHIPCIMFMLEEKLAEVLYCRVSLVTFAYSAVGMELTLHFNAVARPYHISLGNSAEVLALLIGAKCLIWGALKPERQTDPRILLVPDAPHRVPVSWPYSGVDLQGVMQILHLAWPWQQPPRLPRSSYAADSFPQTQLPQDHTYDSDTAPDSTPEDSSASHHPDVPTHGSATDTTTVSGLLTMEVHPSMALRAGSFFRMPPPPSGMPPPAPTDPRRLTPVLSPS